MTDSATALIGGTALLERAVGYTLGSLRLVTGAAMSSPSPCRGWDLQSLLAHMNDSLAALEEAANLGEVALERPAQLVDPRVDPVRALRDRACAMVGAWAGGGHPPDGVTIGGCPVPSDFVTGAGAIEVAVHGWDVGMACGYARPIPARLADELLECCYLLVASEDRPRRFAPRVQVSPWSPASDRLLAYLGRRA